MNSVLWTTGLFDADGEELYYESIGAADDTVVLCHGLGGNHAVWYQQVPALVPSFRVITWDQRGFGMSTNRQRRSGPDAAVGDLAALLDHLGITAAHLVGQSMGGWAIVGFALAFPERVRSLVIADSTGGIVDEVITGVLTTTRRRTVPADALGAHPAISEQLTATDPAKAFLYQQIGGFRKDVEDAEMIAKLLSTRYPLERITRLSAPCLCVVGSDDDLIPPAAVERVAAILGGSFVEIAEAGHSPYFERPDDWNRAVVGFLDGVRYRS